jgi:hexokinase
MSAANPFLEKLEQSFALTDEALKAIRQAFQEEMQRGLSGGKSSLKMLPTFIDRASGHERGRFIALDLGGTNFRVLQVDLLGDGKVRINCIGKYVIPEAAMHGTGDELFGFIARSIEKFLNDNRIGADEKINLGFTFSFPIDQSGITSGTLIKWTKGFSAVGVEGADVVMLLSKALRKAGLSSIEITALANDTVGTLEAKSYEDPDCDVGIIFGTGTNACYREKLANIKRLKSRPGDGVHMIINIEWGDFGKVQATDYDRQLDRSTNNPGRQQMEKMISGLYLGEIARLILDRMIEDGCLFINSSARLAVGDFETRHLSLAESDRSDDLANIKKCLEELGLSDTSYDDRAALASVCRIVSTRAARLAAAAISAIVTWMDPKLARRHTIAIDGSLYEKHPHFRQRIIETLERLHGNAAGKIQLTHAKDGSGIGVAVAAAVATQER